MNERVPDSTGLPLRAMVMVLLFLGVVFLLLGFQAAGSSSGDDESAGSASSSSSSSATSSAAPASETSEEPAPEAPPEVHVLNISTVAGVADGAATQLKDNGVDVESTGDLDPSIVGEPGVFYPEGDAAQSLAEQIGDILGSPVAVRGDNLSEQPPGIIVVVTG